MGRQAGSDTVSAQPVLLATMIGLRPSYSGSSRGRLGGGVGSDLAGGIPAARLKAVVASMGDVAASGGYYIACPADVIGGVARNPDRLDRGLRLQAGGGRPAGTRRTQQRHRAAGRAGLDVLSSEGVQRGRACSVRDDNDAVYDDFVAKVAAGRKRPVAEIEAVARGRVWTGRDASRRVWSMSWAAFVTQFASPGNARTCPRMHLCWVPSAFRRWRGSVGRRTVRIRGPGLPLHGPAFLTWPLHLGCLPTQRFGCPITLQ